MTGQPPHLPTPEELHQRIMRHAEGNFADFMREPIVIALLPMLPPAQTAEQKDLLHSLLRQAFERGVACGSSSTLVEVAKLALPLRGL